MKIDIEKLGQNYCNRDEDLYDYQRDNKEKIYEAWMNNQSVMLQMPTGTGKTRLFVSMIRDIFDYGADNKTAIKILILVHRTELLDQIDEVLGYRYHLAHGIIQSGEKERKIYPIQIASVQTLVRRLDRWSDKSFDFIIVDEAHHIEAKSYKAIINAFPKAKLLGVTATPYRLSGEGFSSTFDELILSPSVRYFINNGYLSQYDYFSVPRSSIIQKEINLMRIQKGDYVEQDMERVCDNDHIRAQVVDTYLKHASGKKGIVYTINKKHNQNLCYDFINHGISAVALDCDTPFNERQQCLDDFRRGKIQIICNVNLFSEGFDCPDIEFVQLARPTKSLSLYLQQVGRGLRKSKEKAKIIILDNVGIYNIFGFPSSNRHWERYFEGNKKKESEGKKKRDGQNNHKKRREQNLEEGYEKVHLIQSTDDATFLESRTKLFWKMLSDYNRICVDVCNKYFPKYEALGFHLYVNDIVLCDSTFSILNWTGNTLYCLGYNKITPEMEIELNQHKFKYLPNDNKSNKVGERLANNMDEFLTEISKEFSLNWFGDVYRGMVNQMFAQISNIDLSIDEILDVYSVVQNRKPEILPVSYEGVFSWASLIVNFIRDLDLCQLSNKDKRAKKTVDNLISGLIEALEYYHNDNIRIKHKLF